MAVLFYEPGFCIADDRPLRRTLVQHIAEAIFERVTSHCTGWHQIINMLNLTHPLSEK